MANLTQDLGSIHYELLTAADKSSDEQKIALQQAAEKVAQIQSSLAYQGDVWFYRSVVLFLGAAILFVVLGIIVLLMNGRTNFESLTAIGSTAVGALAGLFAPSPLAQSKS